MLSHVRPALVALATGTALALSACSSAPAGVANASTHSTRASAPASSAATAGTAAPSASALPAPGQPVLSLPVGQCVQFDHSGPDQPKARVDETTSVVSCQGPHTVEVFRAGSLPVSALAKAAAAAKAGNGPAYYDAVEATNPCDGKPLDGWIGAREDDPEVRFDDLLLSPTPREFTAGARWQDCGVVLLDKSTPTRFDFAPLPAPSMKGFLVGKTGVHQLWPWLSCYVDADQHYTDNLRHCADNDASLWVRTRTDSQDVFSSKYKTFPGEGPLSTVAKAACTADVAKYATSNANWYAYWPNAQSWKTGDRGFDCFIPALTINH